MTNSLSVEQIRQEQQALEEVLIDNRRERQKIETYQRVF